MTARDGDRRLASLDRPERPGRPELPRLPGLGPGALAQALASLLWIPQAALVALAVQRLADGGGLRDVTAAALGLLALGLLRAALEAWGARQVHRRARQALSALRAEAIAALARRSPLDRDRAPSGETASLLAEQAEALVPWLSRHRGARYRAMLVPPLIALAVGSQSWAAALILIGAMPLIPLFMALIGWRAQAASEAHLVELSRMNAFLLDRLRGLSTIRALGAVDLTARRLRDSAESLRERAMRVLRIAFLSSAALELFSALGVALVAVYVGFHLLGPLGGIGAWGQRLTLGEGLFVLMLAPAFFEPLRELAAVWHDRAAGEAALARLERHRHAGVPLPGALGAGEPPSAPHGKAGVDVNIDQLRFGHAGEPPLLDGFTLRIPAGERVALVGPSGAGKSTLLALIAGLLPASGGEIRVGDVPVDEAHAQQLRARMAWIGQGPHVFAGTVQRNVSLDRPGVGRVEVLDALALAALDEVAQALPEGTLGERGIGLSGGELVRLALARAAVHADARLLLVDEPTAHLDPRTADAVIEALLRLARDRTLIVATHDPALIARMDRAITLNAGSTGSATPDTVAEAPSEAPSETHVALGSTA
ncbi:thiol reductant ABC exporter subunit CydD [Roseateles sp. So40a]|uniref:thiol reductant ABC exporter subunit CydD n=1 Tax=Roseateles sp. So40a TaxID=3400226 RepID=UPI003A88E5FC